VWILTIVPAIAISDEMIDSWANNSQFAIDNIEDFGNVSGCQHPHLVNETFASAYDKFTIWHYPY
jgi:hypothetical protein